MMKINMSEEGYNKLNAVLKDYVNNLDANFSDIADVFEDILSNNKFRK